VITLIVFASGFIITQEYLKQVLSMAKETSGNKRSEIRRSKE
jgi:hypothetical protein